MADNPKLIRLLKRYAIAVTVGSGAALSLLWLMQFLIASGEAAITEQRERHFLEFVRVREEEPPQPKDHKPERPEEPPPSPRPIDPNPIDPQGKGPKVFNPPEPPNGGKEIDKTFGGNSFEGDFLPLVRVAPVYPPEALRRGLEGYCDVECTVTEIGTTADVRAVSCTSSLFEKASIKAVQQFRYKPRVVHGVPLAVSGVRHRIRFEIDD